MKNFLRLTSFFFIILSLCKQFICKRQVIQRAKGNVPELIKFFLQKSGAYLKAELKSPDWAKVFAMFAC